MTPADEHDPHETDSYVIDTRRRRGRVSPPPGARGGATRITEHRRGSDDRARRDAAGAPPQEQAGRRRDERREDWSERHPEPERTPSGTRRLPVQPTPAQAPAPTGWPDERAATPPPRRPAPRHVGASPFRPTRRVHRTRRLLALLTLLLLAWLVFLVATPLLAWRSVTRVDATPAGERPAAVSGHNYLLVGSDSRQGMSRQEQDQLSTGDDEGQRTDSIILVHVSQTGQPSALVSLPRDSYVPIPGHGKNKINAAFSIGGPQLLVETVEQATGVPVDGYVEIGFAGFAHVVDSLGGVSIDVPFDMDDYRAGINLKKGVQTLDGPQALGFVRARYSDPEGDLGRAKRQRQFLGAIMHRAVSPRTVLDPVRYWGFTHAAADGVRIGEGTSIGDVTQVLQALRASSGGDGLSLAVPVADASYRTPVGEAVKWDSEAARQLFQAIREDQPLR